MTSPLVTIAGASPGVGRGPGLLALAIVQALTLTLATGARAQDVCKREFHAGAYVWYAVATQPSVARHSESACTAAGGAGAGVRFVMQGSREIIFCDRDLRIPDAMRVELEEAERQVPTQLPSRRRGRAETLEALVRKHSRELVCAPGFERTSDASSELPSVWCQKRVTARELCPRPGSTFSDGACSSTTCPEGTEDLTLASGGKLAGCARCPVGRLDVKETLAWQDPSAWPSRGHPSVTTVLCRARSSDPCPAAESSAARPPSSDTTATGVGQGQ
jgi:hypothetical protein